MEKVIVNLYYKKKIFNRWKKNSRLKYPHSYIETDRYQVDKNFSLEKKEKRYKHAPETMQLIPLCYRAVQIIATLVSVVSIATGAKKEFSNRAQYNRL